MLRRKYLWRGILLVVATLMAAAVAIAWYAASDQLPQSDSIKLLESIMPAYEVQEVHATYVEAPPATAYAAILAVTPGETALARPLMWMRTLPGRLRGARPVDDSVWKRPLLSPSSPAILGQAPGREIVLRLIGTFWQLRDVERIEVTSREQFMSFNVPGFAVSTLSFHIDPDGAGCRVTTITRVRTTDPAARRAFLGYWRVIGTGSAVLRRTWLKAVKDRAERGGLQ